MLGKLLHAQAQHSPEAMALGAPGRPWLTYRGLFAQLEAAIGQLNGWGVGQGDRVAIVLPNGPELAVAFLAAAAGAAAAPLNPAYREAEFEFYLGDLRPKALIVARGVQSPACAVAARMGIAALELSPVTEAEAGRFTLTGGVGRAGARGGFAEDAAAALFLHTSGTTSRPKLVRLTGSNLCASAGAVRESLSLTAADRCLNVMPLFHVHGLVGALLSSLSAGAGVVCSPGFDALRFYSWMDEFRPSWYTAVPTMHQAVLAQAESQRDTIARRPLRFIRSCSSALAPRSTHELEAAFAAPVVEAYGMTEAAHQIASNPLPPAARKPGSVGKATGSQVAILDEEGNLLPPGAAGEVAIRGAGVTPGYEGNPEANLAAFSNGWFRTGDQGRLDEDGYLFLTGRLKEIVNRGGEKISPREIDEVLLAHSAVAQAVAFAVPHPTLGQDVAAAVTLRAGAAAEERELLEFASARLARFKVPQRIYVLDRLPQGATGKLQRIGMAEKLGLLHTGSGAAKAARAEYVAPRTAMERDLADLWASLLGVERVGVNDSFSQLGGDSLVAAQLIARIEKAMRIDASELDLFDAPTVAAMAGRLCASQKQATPTPTSPPVP
jgi:acyl-CoA synthetase (AMP-forming)/AMP-acid ligase II/acyl carrier protein